jgi:hypothetical protein
MTIWYWHQLKCGTILEDIWKVEGEVSAILPGNVFFKTVSFKLFFFLATTFYWLS